MILPNFLCIGVQRSATTWLFNCLREHPEVFVPEVKDVEFFPKDYEKGLSYYTSFFSEATGYKAVGEISPDCLANENCAERIARHLPDAKLIVILRNPIDRAYSAYLKFIRPQTGLSFESAIDRHYGLLEYGLYHEQLMRFFKFFRREQFLILLYEDLSRNNEGALKIVFSYLEVDDKFESSWIGLTSNISVFQGLSELIERCHMIWAFNLIKMTPLDRIRRGIHQRKRSDLKKHKVSKETRKGLIEYFKGPNKSLEKLIRIDLSLWK